MTAFKSNIQCTISKHFHFFLLILLLISFDLCRALDCEINNSNQYKVAYTIIVDQSGHGNFTNIQNAINSIPSGNNKWVRIQISVGKYKEKVTIPQDKRCIFLDGAGSKSTSIEWNDHEGTAYSSTFTASNDNIVVKGIKFKNSYNVPIRRIDEKGTPMTQAVAATIYGEKYAFYSCAFVGLQDTLFDATGRYYFNNCYIEGGVDFIFGSGQSIYERCAINVTIGIYNPQNPGGFITAQGRDTSTDPSGFVFKTCNITGTGKAYLGRAYRSYSRVVFADSTLSDIVVPQGWDAWNYVHKEKTIEYMETGCSGPGADISKRVKLGKETE